jgi:hypothetical protein
VIPVGLRLHAEPFDGQIPFRLLLEHDPVRERTLEITFLDRGAEAYVFTFG